MKTSKRGMTLVELLLGIAISGTLLVLLGRMFSATLRINRVNQQGTSLLQNSEFAVALLESELKDAGYRGGDRASFGGAPPNETQAENFAQVVRWPFSIDYDVAAANGLVGIEDVSGLSVSPLPTIVHVAGTGTSSDSVGLVRVIGIEDTTATDTYQLEYVLYGAENGEYTRLRQQMNCIAPVYANSVCTLDGGNSGRAPTIEGGEDLQVFFKLRRLQGGQPVYTDSFPGDVSDVASIGVYLRLRSPIADPGHTDTVAYPSDAVEPPSGVLPDGTAISSWSDLGVPVNQTYNDPFRRLEKVIEIGLNNSQPCNQLPIAWPANSIPTSTNQATSPTHNGYATPGPGNFGWVTWDGNNGTPALLNALNHPELSRLNYTDPTIADANDPARHNLQVGSVVEGLPGNRNPGNAALAQYANQVILAPVWDKAEGNGANLNYTIAGFARILLLPSSTIGNLQGVYLGPAGNACTI